MNSFAVQLYFSSAVFMVIINETLMMCHLWHLQEVPLLNPLQQSGNQPLELCNAVPSPDQGANSVTNKRAASLEEFEVASPKKSKIWQCLDDKSYI